MELYTKAGHKKHATEVLEEVREQHPKDVELLSRLGEAYMGAGKNSQAETIFGRLAELEPGNAEHASRLGELAIGQGNYDQALEIISPSVDQQVASREGEKASAHLQKILSRDLHHIKTLLKLVEVQTVLKNDAGIVAAYDKLCEGYSKQGDYEKAVRVAEQLIELEPENSQHRDRVQVFGTQSAVEETSPTGNPSDALTDPGLDEMFREFKKGMEKQLGSEDYDTRYNLGIAYKEMGLLDEAIAEFQLASKDEGRLLECCSMLGSVFLGKGNARNRHQMVREGS